jgi:hypothetical protein
LVLTGIGDVGRGGPLHRGSDRGVLARGFPRFLGMVFPGEILQAEHQLNRMAPVDFQPSYYDFTTGRWQGNTLVTKTTGFYIATVT